MTLARLLLVALSLALPARAQEPADVAPIESSEAPEATREPLLERAAAFEAEDEQYNRLRFELVALQERIQLAEDALVELRGSKTQADLADPKVKAELDARKADLEAAKAEFGEKATGAPRARLVSLRDRLAKAFGALLRDLDAALEAHGGDGRLRVARGRLHAGKGQFDLARRDAEVAIRVRPEDPDALVLLGQCLITDNRFEEATALFQRAVELAPSDERRVNLAIGLYCTNRFAEARAARDAVKKEKIADLPVSLKMRCAWWLTDGELDRAQALWDREQKARAAEAARDDLPRVELITSRGRIVLELFEDHAPNAVAGLLELIGSGYYDGLRWHRVLPNLLAQTGDPATKGQTEPEAPDPAARHDPGWALEDDAAALAPATLRGHFRGTVSLARIGMADTGSSHLFITVMPAVVLDGNHTVVGRVVEGQAVVDRLGESDAVRSATVLRKRDHAYAPKKVTAPARPGRR